MSEQLSYEHARDADWRPGTAKRAGNFEEVCSRAQDWRWSAGVTVERIFAAVLKGTPDLSQAQRNLLLIYVDALNQERLEASQATAWPSTILVAQWLGCSPSTARQHRATLEARGYMIRDYTRANRPAHEEAYDLAILAARLPELEAAAASARAGARARREAYQAHQVHDQAPAEAHAGALENERPGAENPAPEQSQINRGFGTVGAARAARPRAAQSAEASASGPGRGEVAPASKSPDRPAGKPPDDGPAALHARSRGSPRRASGGAAGAPAGSSAAERLRQELGWRWSSVRGCSAALPSWIADPAGSARRRPRQWTARAAEQLLGEPARNNAETAAWGWGRHGPRTIVMLAIALEDPNVRDRCRYFGRMCTWPAGAAVDLRLNLRRIRRGGGEAAASTAQPAAAAEASPDPVWAKVAVELKGRLRRGAFDAWFGRVRVHSLEDGLLWLEVRPAKAADQARQHLAAVKAAAIAAGLEVTRVAISAGGAGG